jgi:hypothetical protein
VRGVGSDTWFRVTFPTDVALVRMRAARSMVEAGRRAEADAYLHEALTFYRSVGARHYISEGEALLAASA